MPAAATYSSAGSTAAGPRVTASVPAAGEAVVGTRGRPQLTFTEDDMTHHRPGHLRAARCAEGAYTMSALAATGIVKRYGKRVVLDGARLDLHPGEVVAVVGENGCGKTSASAPGSCARTQAPSAGTRAWGTAR